jgi:chlorobactene glucosyltransferase
MTVTMALLALLLPLSLIALANLLLASRLHGLTPATEGPLVSLVVPARDEADNLRRLLPALGATSYRTLEVIVLDDGSRDATRAVARQHAARDSRFRVAIGQDPPPGWTGKSWACHQLALEARGSILIFCDADVVPGPDAVARTVTALTEDRADVMTAFPRHERGGWLEEAVIPIVAKLPIAALLPLPLVRRTRTPSLAVGNGQWLAWTRNAYHAAGGHARVRDDVLEDVALARGAKEDGLRLAPYVATRDLRVRMYDGPEQLWEGFGKNLYRLVGGSDWTAVPVLGLFLTVMVLPVLLPVLEGGVMAWTPLATLLALRTSTAALFREPVVSILLHPVGVMAAAALLLSSRRRHKQGRVVWKRRTVPRRS